MSERDVSGAPASGSGPPGAFPPGPPPATTPQTSGKATAALVLSILSFVICPVIPAIVALVLASGAKREITSSYGRVGGEGLVKASRIISIINIVFFVLVISLAVAIPTFFGARDRAVDRATQSDLRSALAAEQEYRSETDGWTADPAELSAIEPALQYEPGDTPVVEGIVYVVVEDTLVGLAAKSDSGTCFYLMSDSVDSSVGFAEDVDCGRTQEQDYQSDWG